MSESKGSPIKLNASAKLFVPKQPQNKSVPPPKEDSKPELVYFTT